MANPWDNDPIVSSTKAPWDNDPIMGEEEKKKLGLTDYLKGAGEFATTLGTGTAAMIGGGLAGAGNAALNGMEAGNKTYEDISNAGTYQPRTEVGKNLTEGFGKIMEYLPEKAGEGAEALGGGPGARTAAEAAVRAGLNFLPLHAGIKGVGRVLDRRAPELKLPENVPTPEAPVRTPSDPSLQPRAPLYEKGPADMFGEGLPDEVPNPQPRWMSDEPIPMENMEKTTEGQQTRVDDSLTGDFVENPPVDAPIGSRVGERTGMTEGVPLDLDSHGTLGAPKPLPEDVVVSEKPALETAVEKLSTGKAFDMTAPEKVAWNKAQGLVKEFEPEFDRLSDREIANKAMDRQWAQDAVDKAKQLDQMYAEIEQRSRNAQDIKDAGAKREKLQDSLDKLEDHLRDTAAKPVSDVQGPKTRAAINRRNQGGAVDFEGISEGLKRLFGGKYQEGGPRIPLKTQDSIHIVDPDIPKTLEESLAQGQDTTAKNWTKYTASGATMEAATRRSPFLKAVARTVQNALKRADFYSGQVVSPAERAYRSLSNKEIQQMHQAMLWELKNGKPLDGHALSTSGMTEKQQRAYADFKDMMKSTLAAQNKIREQHGLSPIHALDHYYSSRWQGSFRQPVYDANGKVAWYLSDTTARGLSKQIEAMKKAHPDLEIDPKKGYVSKSGYNSKTDLQSAYQTMLDILGDKDPKVQELKKWVEDQDEFGARSAMHQENHFMEKGGTRGFIGDNPTKNDLTNARDFFNSQFQYSKNAFRWSALQEAQAKLEPLFSSPELAAQQPKNMSYAREYFKSQLGFGQSRIVSELGNLLKDGLGIEPSTFAKYAGGLKAYFLASKLGLSAGYYLSSVLQVANMLPKMAEAQFGGHGGNMLTALPAGIINGLRAGMEHSQKVDTSVDKGYRGNARSFAKDNEVMGTNAFDEAGFDDPRGVVGAGLKALNVVGKKTEVFTRAMAYGMMAEMYKNSKKFASDTQKYQAAEDATNMGMVDYRKGERPLMFDKMGSLGNVANTLQTYPINYYNQLRYFGKEAAAGRPAGLIAALAVQGYLGGFMGLPWANDMDKLMQTIKGMLPDSAWAKVKDFDPKVAVMEASPSFGEALLYGGLSTNTGLGLTQRMAAPGPTDMLQSPGGPLIDAVKQAGAVAKAVADPSDKQNVAMAAMKTLPGSLPGLAETTMFRDEASHQNGNERMYLRGDLNDRKAGYSRTPEEETIRKFGLRSQREVLNNDMAYRQSILSKEQAERSKDLPGKWYDAFKDGDTKRAAEVQDLYLRLNDKPLDTKQYVSQLQEEQQTALSRATTVAKKTQAILLANRINKLLKEHDNAYGR